MSEFDDFWKALTAGIENLAVGALKDYKDQVVKDGQDFANALKADLTLWTTQLANHDITDKDFEWLVESKKAEAKLLALKLEGLAKEALSRFVDDLVNLIITTAGKFF
ncbi:MAG TPA: hypothetical protein VLX91_03855 [Candidatus Acidoferrales bacterium]|nr:hypothetical protein [Candidatus Acidoferrales bacterium]